MSVSAIMKATGHDSAGMVFHYADAIKKEDVHAEFEKLP